MPSLLDSAVALLVLFPLAAQTAAPPPSQASKPAEDLIPAASRVPAPEFTLKDVQGKNLTLSHYRGRVVLLDFWATTCGGCKVELPWYVAFDTKYRPQGLTVIGLDMYGETPEVIKPFLVKWKMDYPVAVGTDELGNRFHLAEMPLTLLIDRNGKIAVSHAGIVDRAAFESDIQTLLHS